MSSATQPHQVHRHIPALDGLRGVAVLTIIIFHFGGGATSSNPVIRTVGQLIRFGWTGVSLFFVLSGFLITGILWASRNNVQRWRTFYLRRTLRIFPLYYAVLLVLLVGVIFAHQIAQAGHLIIYALYAQNLVPDNSNLLRIPGIFPVYHLWSLAVEEQFYLVWPFLLWRMRTLDQARKLCVAVFALSLLCRIVSHPLGWNDYGFTPSRAGELAVGAWIALSIRAQSPLLQSWKRHAGLILVAAAAVVGLISVVGGGPQSGGRLMWIAGLPTIALLYGSLLLIALQPGRIARILSAAPLRFFGTISYGLYIFHVMLSEVAAKAVDRIAPHASHNLHDGLRLVMVFAICVPLATASFHLFERPFLKLKDRLANNSPAPVPNSSQA